MRWSLVAYVLAASPMMVTISSWGQGSAEPPCPPGRICEPLPDAGQQDAPAPSSATPGSEDSAPTTAGAQGASSAAVPAPQAVPDQPSSGSRPGTGTVPSPTGPDSNTSPAPFPHGPTEPARSVDFYIPPPSRPASPWGRRWRPQLGVTAHLDWAVLGAGGADDAFIGGAGAAFRYRPLRGVALETGLDMVGGKDWEGNRRREYILTGSALLYFNPRDAAQAYLLTGLMLGRARVQTGADDRAYGEEANARYSYFGGHIGLGLEWRLKRELALDFAFVGLLRGRTDADAVRVPEFVHEDTGVGSNSSGGGLLRGGATYYF